ncbi:unnamed protein product [Peniophora sp. CBMAI 1063]|nr:unnamed protein product [Peniophora sp. CBMAI 1063]
MSATQTPLDPFVMYTRAADARPSAVDASRWADWQLWKQTAVAATAEVNDVLTTFRAPNSPFADGLVSSLCLAPATLLPLYLICAAPHYKYKRAVERTDPATIPEDVWQKAAEADKAMEEGHQSYATLEKLINEAGKLQTDAARAAQQFANVQAAMQAPTNLNTNGHVTPAAHVPQPTQAVAISKPGASPHVNNPVCDNCRLAGNVICVRAAHPHHRRCTYCYENDTRCSFKESKAAAAAESGEPLQQRKPRASQQPVAVPVQQHQPSAIPVQNAPAPPASAPPMGRPKRKREPGASDDSDEEMGQPNRRYTPPAPPFAAAVPMGVQSYGQMSQPQPQVQYQPQVHYHQQPVQYQPPAQRRAPTTVPERRGSQAMTSMPPPRANGHNNGELQKRVGNAQNLIRTIGFLFTQLDDELGGIADALADDV